MQTTFFLRGRDRFASQFSANHIPFRIAKLRFCIANCDAIPDKFIPVHQNENVKNLSRPSRATLGRIYTTSKLTSTGKIVMAIHETVPYISGNQ